MDLTRLRGKLLSKVTPRWRKILTVRQTPTPPRHETPVAHKSQPRLDASGSLLSKASLSNSLNQDRREQPGRRELSRTDVLLNVLPVLEGLIRQCEVHSNEQAVRNGVSYHRTASFMYLSRVSTAIVLLETYLTTIQETQANEFKDAVSQLEQCLQCMLAGKPLLDDSGDVPQNLLRDLWEQSEVPSKNGYTLLKLAQDSLNSHGNAEWKAISQSMEVLIDQFQGVGHDLHEQNLERDHTIVFRRPLPSVGEFIGHTLAINACACNSPTARELNLLLCTYRSSCATVLPEVVTVLTKDLRDLLSPWAEIHIHGSHDIRTRPETGSMDPITTSWSQARHKRIPSSLPLKGTSCICDYYKSPLCPENFRINIRLKESRISAWWVDDRTLPPADLQHQINLTQLVSTNGSTMTGLARVTLSVFLAYSMFYLYGGSWTRQGWKRQNIVFFADGDTIPMRPFLKLSPLSPLSSESDTQQEAPSFHRYPEFLELGIMLMEILFGQSLESLLGRKVGSLVDDQLAAAWEVYKKRKLDIISRSLREAVGSCLQTDLNMDVGEEYPDDDELRSKFFDVVVRPLEVVLEQGYSEIISTNSLDNEASTKIEIPFQSSTCAPGSVTGTGEQDPRPRATTNVHELEPHRPILRVAASTRSTRSYSPSPVPRSFELFSNESQMTEPPSDMCTETDRWMERFVQLLERTCVGNDKDPSTSGEQTSSRLKVAVLDTGIEIHHPVFFGETRVKDRKSWTGTSADEDNSGHGTHIASTILRLTKNVDLYIAKVTDSNVLEGTDRIADAINFARLDWQVDIISLSFGFQSGVASIQKAINKAVSSDRNMIIFAAASNDASNTPRAYPGTHDRVICVHSANGLGNRSEFNPTALDQRDNFCVVGESIEAAWPLGQTQYKGMRRMSGTSFATPVAVSVAAFMLDSLEKHFPEHSEWLNPLRSYTGVRAIFNALAQNRDGASSYRLVNPLYQFSECHDDEAITHLFGRIKRELNYRYR